jgi:hypothetical protein
LTSVFCDDQNDVASVAGRDAEAGERFASRDVSDDEHPQQAFADAFVADEQG